MLNAMKVIATFLAGLVFVGTPVGAEQPPVNYIAHEWGTFTSVQGADGIQLEWNPLVTSELPPSSQRTKLVSGTCAHDGSDANRANQVPSAAPGTDASWFRARRMEPGIAVERLSGAPRRGSRAPRAPPARAPRA